jgi:hypothetical protein
MATTSSYTCFGSFERASDSGLVGATAHASSGWQPLSEAGMGGLSAE